MRLSTEEIKKIIPHREPMLLVDEVISMEEEKKIITKFHVSGDREIFKGHFPGDPVFPGVYTVEVMAQTADILILSTKRYAGKIPLFIGIDKVKFMSKIKPGSDLEVHAELVFEKAEKGIVTCTAEVYVGENKVAVGDVTLAMR